MDIELFPRQAEVLEHLTKGTANEILYGGAAAGGKSYILRALAIIFCINVPGIQVFLFRRTVKDLRLTHMAGPTSFPVMLSEFVDDKLCNINHSNNYVAFANSSRINLCHCQHDADLNNYLSAEIHILLLDESTTFTEKMIRFLRGRLRLGSLAVPKEFKKCLPFIIYATNPRGVSHAYFKRNFVDANKHMVPFKAPPDEGGMDRVFIPSLLSQNPFIEEGYADRLRGMGDPDVVEAYLSGDWSVVEGAALKELKRSVHVVANNKVCRSWKFKRAYDYGFSAPYSVLFYAIATGESDTDWNPPKGSIIICHNIYGADHQDKGLQEDVQVTAGKILFEEKTVFKGLNVLPGPADNSIFAKEQGPSIAERMALRGIRWGESDKSPGSRVNGLSEARSMIYNAVHTPLEAPGLYFTESCLSVFNRLVSLPLSEKNPEDIDTDANDHDWDVVRYIVLDISKEIIEADVNGT